MSCHLRRSRLLVSAAAETIALHPTPIPRLLTPCLTVSSLNRARPRPQSLLRANQVPNEKPTHNNLPLHTRPLSHRPPHSLPTLLRPPHIHPSTRLVNPALSAALESHTAPPDPPWAPHPRQRHRPAPGTQRFLLQSTNQRRLVPPGSLSDVAEASHVLARSHER